MFKRLLEVCVAFGLVLSSFSCETISSLNVQKSLLRGTGDSGITTVLENQSEEKVQEIADGVKTICNDVLNFLDSGNIAGLTVNELKAELLEVVPEGSEDFVNDILSLVIMQNVDVGSIGSRNVKRIRAFVKGVIRGAEDYAVEDRG